MFKKDATAGGDEIETIIGPSVQVEGNFIANGDIIIEGTVSGNIKTEKNLRIGVNAKIFANITAANALIAGEVQGNIKVKDNLELTESAKVFGDIKAQILNIASGASIHGKCIAGNDKKAKPEKPEDILKSRTSKEELQSVAAKVK